MSIAASKSSLQNNIGTLSRRSKLSAERVSISSSGLLQWICNTSPTHVLSIRDRTMAVSKFAFGNPTVRTISKLIPRVIQITLKVKSTQYLSRLSPTATVLTGSLD